MSLGTLLSPYLQGSDQIRNLTGHYPVIFVKFTYYYHARLLKHRGLLFQYADKAASRPGFTLNITQRPIGRKCQRGKKCNDGKKARLLYMEL